MSRVSWRGGKWLGLWPEMAMSISRHRPPPTLATRLVPPSKLQSVFGRHAATVALPKRPCSSAMIDSCPVNRTSAIAARIVASVGASHERLRVNWPMRCVATRAIRRVHSTRRSARVVVPGSSRLAPRLVPRARCAKRSLLPVVTGTCLRQVTKHSWRCSETHVGVLANVAASDELRQRGDSCWPGDWATR
jgi:hypothetical protein